MTFRVLLIVALLSGNINAQLNQFQYLGEDYFAEELYLGVSIRRANLSFPNAVRAENHQMSVWTGDWLLYRTNIELGGYRYVMRNKILGEIFFGFGENFNDIRRQEGSTFSHFLLGAHTFTWNTVVKDRWALAIGGNLTDLAVGSTFLLSDSLTNGFTQFTPAPHGWYIGGGPSVMADILISDFLLLELQADYTFHFANPVGLTYGEDAPDHPMPRQSFYSAHLLTGWGLYTGFEASFLNDRTSYNNDARKLEWQIGFRFML